MARKKQPTPWEIEIEMHDADDGHHEISLRPKLAPEDTDGYTFAEVLAGYRWVAGIAARAAVALAEEIKESGRTHRCVYPSEWFRSDCGLTAPSSILDPASDMADTPDVWIGVPSEDRKEWLARVKATVARILEAEAWQPGPEDERKWRGEPAPTSPRHVTAPTTPPTREPAK